MDDNVVGTIGLEVAGLDRVQDMIDRLNACLQEAQSIVDGLGTVKLDIKAVIPPGDTRGCS